MNKIGLGTVQFGLPYGINNTNGQTSAQEVKIILQTATNNGISILDTAYAYGNSESILGTHDVTSFKIVSKFNTKTSDGLKIQLAETLKNLNTKCLYGYLTHSVKNLAENPNLIDSLYELKSQGIITKIGCSFNHTSEIDMLDKIGFKPDLIQIPFNLFDNRFKQYTIEAKKWDCEVHSRSAFLQGLFFCNTQNLHSFFNPLKKDIQTLQSNGDKLIGLLLSYCVNQPFIDTVIIGVNTVAQLEQNLLELNKLENYSYPNYVFDEHLITPSEWPKK